jgi:hypothetical protein
MPLAATVTRMPIRSNTRNYPSFASVLASTGVVPAAAIHVQAQPQGPAIPPAPRSTPPAPPRSRSHTEAPRTQAQPTSASGPRPRPRQAQTHPTRRPSCRRPAQDPMMQTVDYRSYDKVELCRRSGPPSPAIQTLDVKIKPEDGTLLGGGSVSIVSISSNNGVRLLTWFSSVSTASLDPTVFDIHKRLNPWPAVPPCPYP